MPVHGRGMMFKSPRGSFMPPTMQKRTYSLSFTEAEGLADASMLRRLTRSLTEALRLSDASYAGAILRDSPVGYWRMGEPLGTWLDQSGGGLNGAGVNTPARNQAGALTGDADGSTGFTAASSQYVDFGTDAGLGDPAQLSFANNIFSMEFWYKAKSLSGAYGVIRKTGASGAPSGSGPWEYTALQTNTVMQFIAYTTGGSGVYVMPNVTIPDTGWHHWVWISDGSNASVYLDGVLATGPFAKTGGNDMSDTTAPFRIGVGGGGGGPNYGDAYIDEVAMYKTVLSATQIKDHYKAGVGQLLLRSLSRPITDLETLSSGGYRALIMQAAPVAYYRLGETSGTVMKDTRGLYDGMYSGAHVLGDTGAITYDADKAAHTTGSGLAGNENIGSVAGSQFDLADNLSLEFWIRCTAYETTDIYAIHPLGKIDDTTHATWSVYFFQYWAGGPPANLGDIQWFATTSVNGWTNVTPYSAHIPADSAWHHVVMTYSSTGGGKTYIDGVLKGTTAAQGTLYTPTTAPFRINGWSTIQMDEVAVYSRVLALQEVQSHYQAGTTEQLVRTLTKPFTEPERLGDETYKGKILADAPYAYYRFNDGAEAQDTFTRADNDVLGSTEVGGYTWSEVLDRGSGAPDIDIVSNKLSGTSQGLALIDLGANVLDHQSQGDVASGTGGTAYTAVRVADGNNYLCAGLEGTSVSLYKIVAGTTTLVGSFTPSGVSTGTIKVLVVGDAVTVYLNGVSRITYTITDASLRTGTKIGTLLTGTGSTFDNFIGGQIKKAVDAAGVIGKNQMQSVASQCEAGAANTQWNANGSPAPTISDDATTFFEGAGSVKVICPGGGYQATYMYGASGSGVIPAEPGAVLDISAYVKYDGTGTETLTIGAYCYDINGAFLQTIVARVTGLTTSWERYSGRMTIPAHTAYIRPEFSNTTPAALTFWIDKVEVYRVSPDYGLPGWYRYVSGTTYAQLGVPGSITDDLDRGVQFQNSMMQASGVNVVAPYTVEFWAKASSHDNGVTVGLQMNPGYPQFDPFYQSNAKPLLYLNGSNYRYGNGDYADGNWHHFVFVVTGSLATDINNSKIYVDGVEEPVFSTSSATAPVAPDGGLMAGDWNNLHTQSMDELAIYPYQLSAAQVKEHYQSGKHQFLSRKLTRPFIDPEGLTDSLLRSLKRILTDPEGLTDVAPTRSITRAITDPEGLTDSLLRSIKRILTDPEGLSDTPLKSLVRILTDPEGLTDSILRSLARAITDPEGLTDSQLRTLTRVLTDPEGLTDSQLRTLRRIITDPEGLTDSLLRSFTHPIIDAEGLTDSLIRTITRALTDSEGLTDSLTRKLTRVLTDSEGLADAILRTLNRILTDSEGLSDVVLRTLRRILSDPEGMTDSWLRTFVHLVTDSEGLTDQTNRFVTYNRSFTDSEGLTDLEFATITKLFIESEGLADTMNRAATFRRDFTDSEGLTDSLVVTQLKRFFESEAVTDSLRRTQTLPLTETMGLIDSITRSSFRTIIDGLGLSDSLLKKTARTLTDSEGLQDSFFMGTLFTEILTDSIGLSDQTRLQFAKSFYETFGLTDTIARQAEIHLSFLESEGLTDQRLLSLVRVLTNPVSLSDLISIRFEFTRLLVETFGITDSMARSFTQVVTDSIGITDSVVTEYFLRLIDPIGLEDTMERIATYIRAFQDSEGLSDEFDYETFTKLVITDDEGLADVISVLFDIFGRVFARNRDVASTFSGTEQTLESGGEASKGRLLGGETSTKRRSLPASGTRRRTLP